MNTLIDTIPEQFLDISKYRSIIELIKQNDKNYSFRPYCVYGTYPHKEVMSEHYLFANMPTFITCSSKERLASVDHQNQTWACGYFSETSQCAFSNYDLRFMLTVLHSDTNCYYQLVAIPRIDQGIDYCIYNFTQQTCIGAFLVPDPEQELSKEELFNFQFEEAQVLFYSYLQDLSVFSGNENFEKMNFSYTYNDLLNHNETSVTSKKNSSFYNLIFN